MTNRRAPNLFGAFFLCFFYFQDLLVSVFFRKFAREKYKYNKEVKVEVKEEVKMEVKMEVKVEVKR